MALPLTKDNLAPAPKSGTTPGQTRKVATGLNNDFSYLTKAANAPDYRPSTDEIFAKNAYQKNVLGPVGLGREKSANTPDYRSSPADITEEDAPAAPLPARRVANETVRRLATTAFTATAASMAFRARVSAVNAAALSWGTTVWLTIQLPFAILGIMGFGMAGMVEGLLAGEGGLLAWLAGKVVKAIDVIASTLGAGLADSAIALFFLSQLVILAVFIFSALALFLQYALAGIHPLSGNGAGVKMGMFLLCLVGYSIPILNIFPFIILWMITVWLFPR